MTSHLSLFQPNSNVGRFLLMNPNCHLGARLLLSWLWFRGCFPSHSYSFLHYSSNSLSFPASVTLIIEPLSLSLSLCLSLSLFLSLSNSLSGQKQSINKINDSNSKLFTCLLASCILVQFIKNKSLCFILGVNYFERNCITSCYME